MTTFLKPWNWLFLYAGLTVLLGLVAGTHLPDKGILMFQSTMAASICLLSIPLRTRRLQFSVFISLLCLFLIVWIIGFRVFNIVHYGNPLGFDPIDSLFYHDIGSRFAQSNLPLGSLPHFLYLNTQGLDDWGFSGLVAIFYRIFGVDWGITALALCNVPCITISAYLLYLFARKFTTETNARTLCLLWAVLPFGLYTAGVGLKENYMVLLVIAAIYYMYAFKEHPNLKAFILFWLFAASLLLFRTAIFFMLAATFGFTLLTLSHSFSRKINLWIIVFIVLAIIFFATAIDFIAGIRGNVNLESIEDKRANLIESQNQLIVILTNLAAIFIGPFPSIISDPVKVNYITLYSFGSFIKMMLSFYYLYGILYIIKHKIAYFYPLLIYIALHSLMLVITFYSLHDRFQWPQYPFVLLLSLFGFKAYWEHRKKKRHILPAVYSCIMLLLILVYNLRLS